MIRNLRTSAPRWIAGLVFLGLLGAGTTAGAQETPTVPSETNAKTEAEFAASMKELGELNTELAKLDALHDSLSIQVLQAATEKNEAIATATRLEAKVAQLGRDIKRQQAEVAALRKVQTQRAIAAYVSGGYSMAQGILDQGTTEDSMTRSVMLRSLNQSDDELAAEIDQSTADLKADRTRQRKARRSAEAASERADAAQKELTAKVEELQETIDETETKSADAQSRVEAALARIEDLRLRTEAAKKAVVNYTLDGTAACKAGTIVVACPIAGQVVAMVDAAAGDGITLTGGGLRDTATQIQLRIEHCDGDVYGRPASACSPPTARPGSSQHELGLAIDFENCASRATPCYQWLAEHAAEYGFKNLPSEAWHWSTTGS